VFFSKKKTTGKAGKFRHATALARHPRDRNLLKMEHRPRRIQREQQKFQAFSNFEQPKYRYFLSSKNGARTTLCVFFKHKNSYKTGSKCRLQRHKPAFGGKMLEIRGNPALPSAKKILVLLMMMMISF
jgi:hypothetical protein